MHSYIADKGEPVESRGRKTTGLQAQSQDGGVASVVINIVTLNSYLAKSGDFVHFHALLPTNRLATCRIRQTENLSQ